VRLLRQSAEANRTMRCSATINGYTKAERKVSLVYTTRPLHAKPGRVERTSSRRELHPLKSSAFHGALLQQLRAQPGANLQGLHVAV
jgi:hypothetical protein